MTPFDQTTSSRPSRFRVEDFDKLSTSTAVWRVYGLFPKVGLVFMFGPSGSAKTFQAIQWCSDLCLGNPILGRATTRCGVLLIAAEGDVRDLEAVVHPASAEPVGLEVDRNLLAGEEGWWSGVKLGDKQIVEEWLVQRRLIDQRFGNPLVRAGEYAAHIVDHDLRNA